MSDAAINQKGGTPECAALHIENLASRYGQGCRWPS
jgi:hypothetical protein